MSQICYTYIDDRLDIWHTIIDETYNKIKQRAMEAEIVCSLQPIDIEPGSAEYEALKTFIGDNDTVSFQNMIVDKFCCIVSSLGIFSSKIVY